MGISEHFEGKDVFKKCLDALKQFDSKWSFDNLVWKKATKFFAIISTGDRNILHEESDFKNEVIPFCVKYIKKNPKEALKAFNFQVLIRRAIRAVGKKEARRSPYVSTLLSRIIDSNNTDVDQETKDKADDLLVFLCTEDDVQEIS